MKRLIICLTSLALLMVAGLVFTGCNTNDDSESGSSVVVPEVEPGTVGEMPESILEAANFADVLDQNNENVILFYYRPDGDYSKWGLWLWEDGGDGAAGYDATKGKFKKDSTTGIGYINFTEMLSSLPQGIQDAIKNSKNLNFIIRDADWGKDVGQDRAMNLTTGSKHFLVISEDSDVYIAEKNAKPSIKVAIMESTKTMAVTLSVKLALEVKQSANGFVMTAADGTTAIVTDVLNYNSQDDRSKNNTANLLLKFSENVNLQKLWTLSRAGFSECAVITSSAMKSDLSTYLYENDDLGLKLNDDGTATFKVWAPIAEDVKLLLYRDSTQVGKQNADNGIPTTGLKGNPSDTKDMQKDVNGIWSYTGSYGSNTYYAYQIENLGKTYYVCDIYANAASADSTAAQIVDINKDAGAIPSGWESSYTNPWNGNDYSEAVIYEMHIRDWSRAVVTDSTGKFLDVAKSNEIIAHLEDLKITHVQILPMFDYAQSNANKYYNWGYNPYHYNVPEGRYVTEGYSDGTSAVKEMRELILAIHNAGIAVNMDVVYNHTNSTGEWSLYDSTIPYYYYRINPNGTYSNGSGCGNEIDSEAPMAKKYIIDSLKHWMTDYHINGFRFDLMGCLSKETMKEIYEELYKIDPKVMVYGEPWTGGDCLVKDGANQTVKSGSAGVGAFDDDFRDAIKGGEFGGFRRGVVQGAFGDMNNLKLGLEGSKILKNNRNATGVIGLALHYAECHDNYTLADKLCYSTNKDLKDGYDGGEIVNYFKNYDSLSAENKSLVQKQSMLTAAYIFLSQGTPFINGGQEFMRTKKGNPDSYSADTKGGQKWTNEAGKYNIDDCNTIDLNYKETFSDVYNTYKGLIALRRENKDAFGSNKKATAETYNKTNGVTKYTTGDFLVYFNATDEAVDITTTGYTKAVDVSSGTPTDSATLPATVAAKSFVILKK